MELREKIRLSPECGLWALLRKPEKYFWTTSDCEIDFEAPPQPADHDFRGFSGSLYVDLVTGDSQVLYAGISTVSVSEKGN